MRVLLVDHDSEGLENIARAIRGVLELDCVTSKGDALLLLRQNQYDVLIACERAVDGSGLDLLGRTTRTAVPLKRIFAAAPERLQLLGPRLAPFKVQRTINYPIDLEELWLAIAQVTGGPNDETDGTIERVVLDERGIPAPGTTPRSPIPPRPPAPLSATPPPAATAIAAAAASGRAATARVAQPAPEPPPRAPARATGPVARVPTQMRATAPAMKPIPPMPMTPPGSAAPRGLPAWTPEPVAGPTDEDFADIASQARLGVQQHTVDDAARRKRIRLFTACGIAVVVTTGLVFALEKFYDPEARAREAAIAASVQRMAEQQKVTDDLTLIEIDIENAIMKNDFATARSELASLIAKSPSHPRQDFLRESINRAEELSKLAPPTASSGQRPVQAAVVPTPSASRAAAQQRPRTNERRAERAPERVAARGAERSRPPAGPARDIGGGTPRSYGAPLGEAPRASLPLNAPINAPPTTTMRSTDNSFSGRTLEASEGPTRLPAPTAAAASPSGSASPPAPAPVAPASAISSPAIASGSAAVQVPPAAAPQVVPQPVPPPPVDVVPAKLVKRVSPKPPSNLPNKTAGYVVVKIAISARGEVDGVEVVESTPPGVFDQSALNAVRKWEYEPRRENGVAVPGTARARLVFEPVD
jgi:periplasmic protein TonB